MGRDLEGNELGKGITQRPDGRYYARLMVDGKTVGVYGKDLESLQQELTQRRKKAMEGGKRDPTVQMWFNEWFKEYKARHVKETSVRPMMNRVNHSIMPYLAKKRLSKLTMSDVMSACNQAMDAGITRGSVREAVARLAECLDVAVMNGYIPINPAGSIVIPKGDEEITGERRYLSTEEIDAVLTEARRGWWYEMIYTAIFTGVRIGELSALCWEDVDFTGNTIHIRRSLSTTYVDGEKVEVFNTCKTRNSARVVPMMGDVKKVLKAQKEKVEELKRKLGKRYRSKGEFENLVFVTTMGSPVTRYNCQKALDRIVDQINAVKMDAARKEKRLPELMEHIYPHALRHTFATVCYAAGVDAVTTQHYMGHANYATTAGIYTHLDSKKSGDEAGKIGAFIAENLGHFE